MIPSVLAISISEPSIIEKNTEFLNFSINVTNSSINIYCNSFDNIKKDSLLTISFPEKEFVINAVKYNLLFDSIKSEGEYKITCENLNKSEEVSSKFNVALNNYEKETVHITKWVILGILVLIVIIMILGFLVSQIN